MIILSPVVLSKDFTTGSALETERARDIPRRERVSIALMAPISCTSCTRRRHCGFNPFAAGTLHYVYAQKGEHCILVTCSKYLVRSSNEISLERKVESVEFV